MTNFQFSTSEDQVKIVPRKIGKNIEMHETHSKLNTDSKFLLHPYQNTRKAQVKLATLVTQGQIK